MTLFSPVLAQFDKLSVFLKAKLLIVGTTLIVATMLTVDSQRQVTKSITNGLVQLAVEMTGATANAVSGAIRFGDTVALQSTLDATLARADGQAVYALALNSAGEVIATSGRKPSGTGSEIETLAKRAMDSGKSARSDNG